MPQDPKRRVTMRDIAAACGVSLATVSGALNYSGRESIRDEVRLRIIRTATQMHYRPAPRREREAPLSAGVILCLKAENAPGKMMLYSDLALRLAAGLRERGFLPTVVPTRDLAAVYADEALKKLDAWLLIDLDEGQFAKRLEGFFGPVLLLEAEADNALYCKVRPDYGAIYARATALLGGSAAYLALEDVHSRSLLAEMTAPFAPANVFVARPGASLPDFLARQRGRKGIILSDLLAAQAVGLVDPEDVVSVCRLAATPPGAATGRLLRVENSRCAEAALDALCAMLDFAYESPNETNHILLAPT